MKTKIVKNYLYEGLGFPVELEAVEMRYIEDDWYPIIDVKKVANQVIGKLAVQESRLTGNQVKFIRTYYSMPLREFGKVVVHESHTAVSKWEKREDLPTNMNINTEHELRLYIVERTYINLLADSLVSNFYDKYKATKKFLSESAQQQSSIIYLDACALDSAVFPTHC